ncbi:PRD domain-containing protein [Paenibacillus sp. LMG 31459]|uniref:PRD domain-containing protein n=1 Tax=Paenibacillus phytohabitans TaxID=2654978 RepID=A0ABX1YC33_9BACL|nr:BglG family transcription antiterminator [Paenibacillus phytohabitans]NOU77483.1 PRD domain-containing protein [Paenibacillus phytohabitans]
MGSRVSKRQKDILLVLSGTKDTITAEMIAKELGVSDRTVRNELKAIQADCRHLGVVIESVRGLGYKLQVTDPALYAENFSQLVIEKKEEYDQFLDQDGRVLYLLKVLLLSKKEIKIEQFEDKIYVSKSTIQNDLKKVREYLSKHQLKLVYRPHYGIMVEGDEYKKRLCLSEYFYHNFRGRRIQKDSSPLLDQQLYVTIKDIIIKKINEYTLNISDMSLENLATHIAIACKRIEQGFIIEHFKEPFDSGHAFEKKVAEELIIDVQAYTHLQFPDSEIDYIIVHLLGTRLLQENKLSELSWYEEVNSIVQRMIKRLDMELNWDFHQDYEFSQALTLHLRAAINRLRFRMNIRNPLLDEIKLRHPGAFEAGVVASRVLEEYTGIEPGEHEIAYIALHIGVALERKKSKQKKIKRVIIVCASGLGSAHLLAFRIKQLFSSELEIVDIINYYNLLQYDMSSIDLIISTIPIKENLSVPIEVVNTFLNEEDVEELRKKLLSGENKAAVYLHPSRIFMNLALDTKEKVIGFLGDELYKRGLVPENYTQLVLEREEFAPTCFGNLVAIPHPISPVTDETFWTICTLQSPIDWHNNQMVQVVVLLNIQKEPGKNLEEMYKVLIQVIENKTIVQNMIKSKSVAALMGEFN